MLEKKRPRVILLEDNDAVLQSANTILSKEGWDVTCEQVSKNALQLLKQSKDGPFALFISNYKLPEMEGDDILWQVKKISPLTQRMLMISAQEPDILINSINKAEINACINTPFKAEDLVHQSRICFKHFKREVKRQRLKRITAHQNKQMFKIARGLKKKDRAYQTHLEGKRAQVLKLKSKKREAENTSNINSNISLSAILDHKKIKPTPENFETEFIAACQMLQSLFDKVANQNNTDPVHISMDKLFSPDSIENQSKTDTKDSDIQKEGQSDAMDEDTQKPSLKSTPESTTDSPEKDSIKNNLQEDKATSKLIDNILKFALTQIRDIQQDTQSPDSDTCIQTDENCIDDTQHPLDTLFEISISENQTKAEIKRKPTFDPDCPPSLSDILDWLSLKLISYGILENEAIETWLKKPSVDEITIAKGEAPVFGQPGIITYQFETDFTNPGKIHEDGTIDFRDRGDIPYVKKGKLLAQKIPAKQGKPGISLSGIPIPVEDVVDTVLAQGTGVTVSEDGLSIYADIDGQPHVDSLGAVSVSSELVIKGDVNFETGNIDFNGNIIVKGMVKEGFTVKGISLTAQEIEGATIDLSGDLNVCAGITDARICAQGNIHAKFINNSNIMGFGDIFISKEIIDSQILLSGCCQNTTGHIISSKITAKLGVEAGKIGTAASTPSHFIVGIDEHVETIKEKIDKSIETSVNKSNLLKDDIKNLEDQDQSLYQQISEKAHIQDRAQLDIKEIKESLPDIKKSRDMIKLTQASNEIKNLVEKAKTAENELNVIFENQDNIARRIEQIKNQLALLEEKNKAFVLEKRALKEFAKKHSPVPFISAVKTIAQGTVIKGPHSSIIIREDKSGCKIQELESQQEGIQFFEMVFSDLH
ncbi:MAG: FapA family protein [Desulfobacula sp.]|nr:FapA family protein [Desulfobacula sp.]